MDRFTDLCVILVQAQCESSLYTVPILLQVLPDQAQKYSLRGSLSQIMVDKQPPRISHVSAQSGSWSKSTGSQFRDVLTVKKNSLVENLNFLTNPVH